MTGLPAPEQWVLSTMNEMEVADLDMKAVREKLSPQFMRAHTTVTPVRAFRTKARKQAED